jgi:hypothetical protein
MTGLGPLTAPGRPDTRQTGARDDVPADQSNI